MTDLTPRQKEKLLKLAKLANLGTVGVAEEIAILEDSITSVTKTAEEAVRIAQETQKMEVVGETGEVGAKGDKGEKGDKGDTGSSGKNGIDGKNGRDGKNGSDGKNGVDGKPADETLIIDKIEKDLPMLGTAVRDGLELLQGEDRLDVSAIKGIEKQNTLQTDDILNRAVGIVDQRTSFLVQKVSNLQDKVDRTPASSSNGWTYYATTWSTAPSVNSAIAGGTVYDYTLSGTTRYRFVPTTYDPTTDAFYSTFSGGVLSGIIVARG